MESMTIEQFTEIVKFVQEYHAFANYISNEEKFKELKQKYPNLDRYGFSIKYVDMCYDSRDGKVWSVTFRGFIKYRFSSNHFDSINPKPKGWKYDTLYDLCMAFLKGEFKPKKEFELDNKEE